LTAIHRQFNIGLVAAGTPVGRHVVDARPYSFSVGPKPNGDARPWPPFLSLVIKEPDVGVGFAFAGRKPKLAADTKVIIERERPRDRRGVPGGGGRVPDLSADLARRPAEVLRHQRRVPGDDAIIEILPAGVFAEIGVNLYGLLGTDGNRRENKACRERKR